MYSVIIIIIIINFYSLLYLLAIHLVFFAIIMYGFFPGVLGGLAQATKLFSISIADQ